MRYFLICSLALMITACGNEPNPEKAPMPPPVKPEVEAPDPVVLTEEEKVVAVRTEYELIVREVEGDVLKIDSLEYSCDFMGGKFLFYTGPENDLRLAVNAYHQGDHFGATEYWYFAEGQPVFLFKESGSWQFGGKMMVDENGHEYPGTIDSITEDRMYFSDGELIRHLTKDYVIKSFEEPPLSDEVPNKTVAHNGEIPASLAMVRDVFEQGKVDCAVLE